MDQEDAFVKQSRHWAIVTAFSVSCLVGGAIYSCNKVYDTEREITTSAFANGYKQCTERGTNSIVWKKECN